jgi:hypothetical protein
VILNGEGDEGIIQRNRQKEIERYRAEKRKNA